jgi:hypothetical protein
MKVTLIFNIKRSRRIKRNNRILPDQRGLLLHRRDIFRKTSNDIKNTVNLHVVVAGLSLYILLATLNLK